MFTLMHVPFFTLGNYRNIMWSSYEQADTTDRISFWDIIAFMQPSFIQQFATLDARQISAYITNHHLQKKVTIGTKQITTTEALVALKLMMPTLYDCDYFLRNQWVGQEHVWVDIMMPRGTPIMSFTTGEVVRIKHRDGSAKNEWNCVVIKTPDNHFIGYEHLETIDVHQWQLVTQATQIWRCGTTWNSTQYHLHLQVDKASAPFHPMRSRDYATMKSHTVDPFIYLQQRTTNSPFIDLPDNTEQQDAIAWLHAAWIVNGFEWKVFPDNTLQRYEMALLLHRILEKRNMYTTLKKKSSTYTPYTDLTTTDVELLEAVRMLQAYGIMKWHNNKLYPYENLSGEELLALLGRIFYGLEDSTSWKRRDSYLTTFVNELLINSSRWYIRKAIPRKEVFVLLWKLLKR